MLKTNIYKIERYILHMETVTLTKKEYSQLKKKAEMADIDTELVEKMKRSFENIKHGRVSEWKPK